MLEVIRNELALVNGINNVGMLELILYMQEVNDNNVGINAEMVELV